MISILLLVVDSRVLALKISVIIRALKISSIFQGKFLENFSPKD